MATIKVKKLKSIPAEITVPGDKSISHRAAMFAGMADGRTVIEGFLPSEDCMCTVKAMQARGGGTSGGTGGGGLGEIGHYGQWSQAEGTVCCCGLR